MSEPASRRPFAWERSYPEGGRWDAPIAVGTLPGLLDAAAAKHGPRTAIEFREARITYARLAEMADRAAAGFMRLGVRRGDPVALLLPNTPWHPVAFFGVLKAGGTVVHLSPLDPPRALARKMADSGARLLVTTDAERVLRNALAQLGEGAERIVVGPDADWGGPGIPLADDDRVISWRDFETDPAPGPAVPRTAAAPRSRSRGPRNRRRSRRCCRRRRPGRAGPGRPGCRGARCRCRRSACPVGRPP